MCMYILISMLLLLQMLSRSASLFGYLGEKYAYMTDPLPDVDFPSEENSSSNRFQAHYYQLHPYLLPRLCCSLFVLDKMMIWCFSLNACKIAVTKIPNCSRSLALDEINLVAFLSLQYLTHLQVM